MGETRGLFKKIGDINGTFHPRIGMIKDRKGKDLTEAEEIKNWWQEQTEELYKKDLNDPDSHNYVATHLELDILTCEVKWALGSITMNKTSGNYGISAQVFQIQKMMLLKSCTQYVSKLGKLSNDHRTGKGQFFIPTLKKGNARVFKLPHNCTHFKCEQGNSQNSSSQVSAVHELRISRCTGWIQKGQRNQKSNCQHPLDHKESKGLPEKHLLLLYRLC